MGAKTSTNDKQVESSKNQLSLYSIFWERTKRPLIFVTVCLLAVFFLLKLYETKTDYDRIKNSPLVVVDKKTDTKSQKAVDAKKLVALIVSLTEDGKTQTEITEIVKNSVSEVKFLDYKNEDELIKGLSDAVLKKKSDHLKDLKTREENTQKDVNDIKDQERKALSFFESKTKSYKDEDSISLDDLSLNSPKAKSPTGNKTQTETIKDDDNVKYLAQALNIELKSKKRPFLKKEIQEIVEKFYKEKLSNQTDELLKKYKTEANRIDEKYQGIIKNTYLTKGDRLKSAFFPKDGESAKPKEGEPTKPQLTSFADEKNSIKTLLFDSNGGLNMIYKLAEMTLTVVIVFGLLYLILIPLKYIFFLSTSAETLREQGKKFLERKEPPVIISQIGKALLVTAGTLGIGAAVVANTNFHSFSAENTMITEKITEVVAGLNKNKQPPTLNTDSPLRNPQNEIDRLAEKVQALSDSFGRLDQSFRGLPLDGIQQVSTLVNEVQILNQTIGKRADTIESNTLFGQLNDISTSVKTGDESVIGKLATVENRLYDPVTPPDFKLFDRVKSISNSINNRDQLVVNRLDEVAKMIDDPTNPPQENSLFRKFDWFSTNLNNVSDTLGTTDYIAKKDKTKNLFLTLDKVDGYIGNPNDTMNLNKTTNTLFGKVNIVSRSIGTNGYYDSESSIFETLGTHFDEINTQTVFGQTKLGAGNTTETGRFLAGESGNIFTPVKRLFFGKQYLVNPFLTVELKSKMLPRKALYEMIEEETAESLTERNRLIIEKNKEIDEFNQELTNLTDKLTALIKDNEFQNISISEKKLLEKLKPVLTKRILIETLAKYRIATF